MELLEALKEIQSAQGMLSWLDVFNMWARARAAGPEGPSVQATAEAALSYLEESSPQPSYEAIRLLARAILGWWSLAVDAVGVGDEAAGLRVRALALARQLDEVTERRWALADWLEAHSA
ncbi:hypothetical protein HRbin22_01061 [Candidatus Thermoflexus japonica]|uniref:Uncharacterized protein n=1 Tax=Candidatus Thermoflexus japonica TaxID=2035417 RepID=A0A2H5Y5V3_9CHLR|nr:hypothetical protein HRbin22_01061 [Candidatus Thermoflexus japonica]